MKLELKHLAPYLPYGLEAIYNEGNEENTVVSITGCCLLFGKLHVQLEFKGGSDNIGMFDEDFKPILRPLSDLTKEIEHNGECFNPAKFFEVGNDDEGYHIDFGGNNARLIEDLGIIASYNDNHDLQFLPSVVFNQLIKWHFDVLDLIQSGLAIDINTLKTTK